MIRLGFGQHKTEISTENLVQIIKINVFVAFCSVVACAWCKTSFAFTLLRLATGWIYWAVWFIIITMNSLMAVLAILIVLRCNSVENVKDSFAPNKCVNPRYIVHYAMTSASLSTYP
jgi:hypothetical protein